MSKFNHKLRWMKRKHYQTNNANKINSYKIKSKTSDDIEKYSSNNPFYTLKQKFRDKINNKNIADSFSICQSNKITNYHLIKERKTLNDYSTYSNVLKGFSNKFTNSSISVNSIKDIPNQNCFEGSEIFIDPISINNKSYIKNNICKVESWKEDNFADKIKLAWLSCANSLTSNIIPLVNQHMLANPFMLIPIEISRIANNNNLNMAEVLCRKRTETAVIYWMFRKMNKIPICI